MGGKLFLSSSSFVFSMSGGAACLPLTSSELVSSSHPVSDQQDRGLIVMYRQGGISLSPLPVGLGLWQRRAYHGLKKGSENVQI